MRDAWIDQLMKWSGRRRTVSKPLALTGGIIMFLLVIPALLLTIAFHFIEPSNPVLWPPAVGRLIAAVGIPTGLLLLLWAVVAQWRIGEGTPAYFAPTQKLVVSGPYRWCRNPIQLGAIVTYFGFLSLLASPTSGFALAAIAFLVGSAYHRFVEERELERRFGESYLEYRRRTPFIIPRMPRRR